MNRRILTYILLIAAALILLTACNRAPAEKHLRLAHADWAEDVRTGLNDMLDAYGIDSENYREDTYAVFDFDNTCSIFDVEEQLFIYQLRTMSFEISPEQMPDVLLTGLTEHDADKSEYGYGQGSYLDWTEDITKAYAYLYETYGPFTAAGLNADGQTAVQADPHWPEFAAKLRAMYDLVYDAEGADAAYPWVTYLYTGMTEQQVYELAEASHRYYKEVETSVEHWESPADIDSKVGVVSVDWTSGIQVTDNIVELWNALKDNGIDVWVCSASHTDVVRAAVDVFGLHDHCTGILAMTNRLDENGIYINEYDYENGCGWYAGENGEWTKMTAPEKAQTQGRGKVNAIVNAIAPEYGGHGPIAGFMDSTGDFNFCTEFDTLKVVVCFNRASRSVKDGGGLIAELAMYQKNTLGCRFADADAAGDTLYLLQGRDENGLRSLRPSNATLTYGSTEERLFKNEDNETQLNYISENLMTVGQAINTFAVRHSAGDADALLDFDCGFLTEYDGYHSHP